MQRLTGKKFLAFINQQFAKFEMSDYEAYAVERSRFTPDQYEGGACFLYVRIRTKSQSATHQRNAMSCDMLCFYPLKEYAKHLANGYEMYLKMDRSGLINNMTIELRKIKK